MRHSRLSGKVRWIGLLLACAAGVFAAAPEARAQFSVVGHAVSAPASAAYDVEDYDVDGVTLIPTDDIEAAVYPFLGPGRTAADIDHAREAVQKVYSDRGYQTVVVQLPAQAVSDNIVRIHVIEEPLGRLRVTGSRYFSPDFIRGQVSALKEGAVPNVDLAQSQLSDVNRLSDRQVTPVLTAGAVPGTVDIDLKVHDNLPVHGSVELNNDHNENTRSLRLTATASYANLWQLGHTFTFTYAVAPQDRAESEIFAGSYLAPIWGSPWSVLLNGYTSNSNVATIGAGSVLGKGYTIAVTAIRQLPRFGGFTDTLTFGMAYKDSEQNTTPGQPCTPKLCSFVSYFPFNLAYNIQRSGPRFSTTASASVTASSGFNSAAFQNNSRAKAFPTFVHVNLDVAETEALPFGFQAFQHVTGQYSDGPMESSEEFAAGGLTSVRGYLQAEAIGDDGVAGTLELRSPSLASYLGPLVDDLRFYAFTDAATLRVLYPLSEQTSSFNLASVGGGLRLYLLGHFTGDVGGALPLRDGPATHADHPRLIFDLKSDF